MLLHRIPSLFMLILFCLVDFGFRRRIRHAECRSGIGQRRLCTQLRRIWSNPWSNCGRVLDWKERNRRSDGGKGTLWISFFSKRPALFTAISAIICKRIQESFGSSWRSILRLNSGLLAKPCWTGYQDELDIPFCSGAK